MARPLRVDLPNAAYYVTSRGLEGQGMVRDEEDCGKWLEWLDGVARRRHGRRGPLLEGRFKAILIEPGYRYWEISRHVQRVGRCEAELGLRK